MHPRRDGIKALRGPPMSAMEFMARRRERGQPAKESDGAGERYISRAPPFVTGARRSADTSAHRSPRAARAPRRLLPLLPGAHPRRAGRPVRRGQRLRRGRDVLRPVGVHPHVFVRRRFAARPVRASPVLPRPLRARVPGLPAQPRRRVPGPAPGVGDRGCDVARAAAHRADATSAFCAATSLRLSLAHTPARPRPRAAGWEGCGLDGLR